MFFAFTRVMKNPFGFSLLFKKASVFFQGRSHKRVASILLSGNLGDTFISTLDLESGKTTR